jgi:transcriptional regulator with XRE-family HTH domain
MTASAYQLAKNARVAAKLREAAARMNMRPADVQRELGINKTSTLVYPWFTGAAAPTLKYRRPLAKILKLSLDDLTPADEDTPNEEPDEAESADQNGQDEQAEPAPRQELVPVPPLTPPQPQEVFSFKILANGQAHVQLNLRLPLEDAIPLARFLMDAEPIKKNRGPWEP